jgi:tRNA acetyltransferase TAN1
MSVVDGDYWSELKRYNLTELYSHANNQGQLEENPAAVGEEQPTAIEKGKSSGNCEQN